MGWKISGAAFRGAPPFLLPILVGILGAACAARPPGGEYFPALVEYSGRRIEEVRFVDPEPFTEDTLEDIVETEPSGCKFLGLPLCVPFTRIGRRDVRLDLRVLRRDIVRLELFYRRNGFFGTQVEPVVEPVGDDVEVSFVIARGDSVIVGELDVTGLEGVLDRDEVLDRLPLEVGDLFDLDEFEASGDTVLAMLASRGHAYAKVLRNFEVDLAAHVARARLEAVPGPRVVIDSIVVIGAEHLGRRATLRQLTFSKGDLLRLDELAESQANLYELPIVQLASVSVAPDSLQVSPGDSTTATVLVRIDEGPVHVVEAAVGYGTVECFRAEGQWVSRSFGGGARRLELVGSLSKIGVGASGFGAICGAFEGDTLANRLDYRFAAELTQPGFMSPRNALSVSAFAERQSEPNVYQREAFGSRWAIVREVGLREVLTTSIELERGKTVANAAVFCFAFLVCQPSDVAALAEYRWRNDLGLNWALDRTDVTVDPTRGYILRSGATWSPAWMGSAISFLRWTGEGSRYRTVRPEWVLALHLRLGTFFGTASIRPGSEFLPPEDRFYAGGAGSVRGYGRNELGPGVYVGEDAVFDPATVDFFPIGGTSVVVGNVELRFPAPFARDVLRLALFVDGGILTTGTGLPPGGESLRITPGFGVGARTPIGPVRLDVGFNPYDPTPGPLYLPDPATDNLIRVADRFAPDRGSFWDRFQLHLTVGQPF